MAFRRRKSLAKRYHQLILINRICICDSKRDIHL
uniref:Uncharacterized protein n=1 Tax=Lepeophtheirus salmonis TaxID=72036 RepID=A0A0K2U8K9_LEPSM